MEASIELYQPHHEHLKFKRKHGDIKPFVWIARIGVVSKICPSERSASNWLEKHGFIYDFDENDKLKWIHKRKSEYELFVERNYSRV